MTSEILTINGNPDGRRVSSKVLEEQIQQAVTDGARQLVIQAQGQHGIGGRIWPRNEKVSITVCGPVGQRLGSMGMFGTEIVVEGSGSDDVGWLNCGARITMLGDVTNGAHNAGAQGILYVQGGGGARCDTMTKRNPRFEPLQSWYFRDVGDSFAEFKAGGIAVVCGVNPRNPENILGYRPCVGMVGGTIYFRGPIKGYSAKDVRLVELTSKDWEWLTENIKPYLEAIDRTEYHDLLTQDPSHWKKLIAYTPAERLARPGLKVPFSEFRTQVWEKDVGQGGIFGEYIEHPQTILPYITTGADRRLKPVWNNEKYLPPCVAACPSGIPSHKRAALIREGRLKEALSLVLKYSPFPATVCGQLCPNLCMQACTRALFDRPLDIVAMGRLSLDVPAPKPAPPTGRKVGIIGGGPGGMSAAWQLALKGHEVDLYESAEKLGGKMELCIPRVRLSHEVLEKEISRFNEIGVHVHLGQRIDLIAFLEIYQDHEAVIIACGAHQPRTIPFPGNEEVIAGIEFLKAINLGKRPDFKDQKVVIIGAGNVGMDIACEAYECGAASVTAVDIQPPASFGKEQEAAEAKGTRIIYPKITERYDKAARTIYFKDGTSLEADTVIISIGEVPILDFLPREIHTERGFIVVNELGQTSDVKVFAAGDVTRPGLITHAIGAGRQAAETVHAIMMHTDYQPEKRPAISYDRIKLVYYEVSHGEEFVPEQEAYRCASCGACRDCHMCENTCYHGAIKRIEGPKGEFEYTVIEDKCIGCGFCAAVCPCGVWEMEENI
jgi:NADPH-dependent glutamate synthase beta subunit-like oxidoreductase/glutamate synthase domain-containing protein 3/NAD-dependent dihydropyrimidine dehydrogenase PreA subunit